MGFKINKTLLINSICVLPLLPTGAEAAWQEKAVIYEKHAEGTASVREALTYVEPSVITTLSSENLTSRRPVVIKSLYVKATLFVWRNERNCSVLDPTRIRPVVQRQCDMTYQYFNEDGTAQTVHLAPPLHLPTPCEQPLAPAPRQLR